jgi:hypothetical protein
MASTAAYKIKTWKPCGGMGFDGRLMSHRSSPPNVRFGSKADIGLAPVDVRFILESGHCR